MKALGYFFVTLLEEEICQYAEFFCSRAVHDIGQGTFTLGLHRHSTSVHRGFTHYGFNFWSLNK